jgi:hypothetical protein
MTLTVLHALALTDTLPQARKEGLKLFVQYKKAKDDDEVRFGVSDSSLAGAQFDHIRHQEVKSLQPDKNTLFKKMSDSDLHLIGLSDEYACPVLKLGPTATDDERKQSPRLQVTSARGARVRYMQVDIGDETCV